MYPIELVKPMAKELTDNGFEALSTPEQVENLMENQQGTALIVVNSVCGCAAANARPGARLSLGNAKHPEKLYTVFAGVDKEATRKMREYFLPYPPSSPSMALFKDGKLVHFVERLHIEGHSAQMVAANLTAAYEKHC
ncbi:MAG: BrxA/BrxB family bacilliredoxin [Bacteroidota bacterium]